MSINLAQLMGAISSAKSSQISDGLLVQVIWQLRLPETLIALAVGVALALAGAVLQGFLRNPLADPALLGVSGGASFIVVLLMVLVPQLLQFSMVLPVFAFVGGVVGVFLIYVLARFSKNNNQSLLLAGIAINAMFAAGIVLLLALAQKNSLPKAIFWSFGGINFVNWHELLLALLLMGIGVGLLLSQARPLDVLSLGEADAVFLGVNIARLRVIILLGVALSVGSAVALAGPIAFVGLMVPHIARIMFGASHKKLLPASMLLGACLVLAARLFCNWVIEPAILPLGVATALLGAPFFIWLLWRC